MAVSRSNGVSTQHNTSAELAAAYTPLAPADAEAAGARAPGRGPASREASLAPSAARGLRTSMGPRSLLPGHPRGSTLESQLGANLTGRLHAFSPGCLEGAPACRGCTVRLH